MPSLIQSKPWRSLEELDDASLAAAVAAEYPSLSERLRGPDRREVLRVMAASLMLGGLTACEPERSSDAVPYVTQPDVTAGELQRYATAVLLDGVALPVLATSNRGRPTKLEGNSDHPAGHGATDPFLQAAILDLYDPDRSQGPLQNGDATDWAAFDRFLAMQRAIWRRGSGAGLALLLGPSTSPTLLRQIVALRAALPQARVFSHAPVGDGLRMEATRRSFGQPLAIRLHLDRARVLVSLDDDLLGPGPKQARHARDWSQGRGRSERRIMTFAAECTPGLTGAAADVSISIGSTRVVAVLADLARRFGLDAPQLALEADEKAFCDRAAVALTAHRDEALVTVGPGQPPDAQALAFALNDKLGAIGSTLTYYALHELAAVEGVGTTSELASSLNVGAVETLIIADCNPVYDAPGNMRFPDAITRARVRIHAGDRADETASLCQWHWPLSHALERWGDAHASDGTVTLMQPLIAPIYESRSLHQLIDALTQDRATDDRDIVRATWSERLVDNAWQRAVHDGFVPNSAPPAISPPLQPVAMQSQPSAELEIVFRPDPTLWDGRFANNAWLQEMPKPLWKVTWDTIVAISPALGKERGIRNGDIVRLASGAETIEGPAWLLPKQARDTITLYLGGGRTKAGRIGNGVGYSAYTLRRDDALWQRGDVTLTRTGRTAPLATTQTHHRMEGEDTVRTVSAAHPEATRDKERDQSSFFEAYPRGEVAWAMAIDLDKCIGCNACAVACQAENNVPIVGREAVLRGREMHWLRIDRYYDGAADAPETLFQPVPCMHCEQAPCEMGCPVHATVHSPDGLNTMVYNRCIGTRTCSSYCPYKVRRFNWFDLTSDAPEPIAAQRNPDVTVRGRGVMEKCTYCVQRLRAAGVAAEREGRALRGGDVQTACQAACPSEAISFGNLAESEGSVSRARQDKRHYALLGDLGTRPRTTYLARIAGEDGS